MYNVIAFLFIATGDVLTIGRLYYVPGKIENYLAKLFAVQEGLAVKLSTGFLRDYPNINTVPSTLCQTMHITKSLTCHCYRTTGPIPIL